MNSQLVKFNGYEDNSIMIISQKYYLIISLFFCIFFQFTQQARAIPAFPGAEGFGADAVGGRGGIVIKVSNLNDNGAGSLRAAVEQTFPRIIIFEVSGIIYLESTLKITSPYITIAGQTSPEGIMVSGKTVLVNTHDVLIQHMRFGAGTRSVAYNRDENGDIIFYDRPQYYFPPQGTGPDNCAGNPTSEELGFPCAISGGSDPETLDTFVVAGKYWAKNEAYNIMIDHCSFRWGVDETLTLTGGVTNTTIQWSIVSEGLDKAGHPKGKHSKGLMVSGKFVYPNTISLHHNYIAHHGDRSPLLMSPEGVDTVVDFVNNVVYNWDKRLVPYGQEYAKINWVNNYAKIGPSSYADSCEVGHWPKDYPPAQILYVQGNIGATRLSQSAPQWNVQDYFYNRALPVDWQKTSPWPAPSITSSEMSVSLADCILSAVGATAPKRDSVDTRVIRDFSAGSGKIINNVVFPQDYPLFETKASPPIDSDNDGMPDSWEAANGLNPTHDDSALDKNGDGYTNIEEYLHYLSTQSYSYNSSCMPLKIKGINIMTPYGN
ncbi:MAG: hypothetical protein ACOY32_07740 [Thermodesulfobacteriota bacterium]